jgi:hypothetical protein
VGNLNPDEGLEKKSANLLCETEIKTNSMALIESTGAKYHAGLDLHAAYLYHLSTLILCF